MLIILFTPVLRALHSLYLCLFVRLLYATFPHPTRHPMLPLLAAALRLRESISRFM